jgi:hypothetical protein
VPVTLKDDRFIRGAMENFNTRRAHNFHFVIHLMGHGYLFQKSFHQWTVTIVNSMK